MPKAAVDTSKEVVDGDTITALLKHRFQIMSRYGKEVILPVLQEERVKACVAGKKVLDSVKTALTRDRSLVKEQEKPLIASALEKHASLQLVYQYQARLHEIWERTTATQKELIEAIQEWCRQAEATGINALREFSRQLKGYQVVR